MKLTCVKDNLTHGLSVVGRAVASRTTLPVTQNVLITTDNARLKLSATNLEIAITTWIGVMVEEEGSITVPARLFSEFVNSLPSEHVAIADATKPRGIQLVCGRAEARINGTDAEEFPPIPTVEEGIPLKVTTGVLRNAISRVVFAAATEESRPVLTGVKLEVDGDQFTMAAADGFRLAVQYGKLEEAVSEPVEVIIPAKALQEIGRFLDDSDPYVEIMVTESKSQILFKMKDIEVVSQLIQGTFPNYKPLIPDSHQTSCKVPLDGYLQVARTASIFARDGNGIVRIELIPSEGDVSGKIIMSARTDEVGDHKGELDASVEGEMGKVAFNSRYLMDVLSAVDSDEISLELGTPSSPGVFRMVGSDDYVHVVMPMFVQW